MDMMDQSQPEHSEPWIRYIAFGFSDRLRWNPNPRPQFRELRAYPGLLHIGGTADHLLKHVTDLRLSAGPLPITSTILMFLFYWNWFFGGITRPFNPDHPWLWLVMILSSVMLLTRTGSLLWIQVTFSDDSGQEQTAYLIPLNDSETRRDPAINEFLMELREAVLGDPPIVMSRKESSHGTS